MALSFLDDDGKTIMALEDTGGLLPIIIKKTPENAIDIKIANNAMVLTKLGKRKRFINLFRIDNRGIKAIFKGIKRWHNFKAAPAGENLIYKYLNERREERGKSAGVFEVFK